MTDLPTQKLAYSVDEAGEAIGVSKATIWRLIASDDLHVTKVRGRTLIEREQLEALLARGRVAA